VDDASSGPVSSGPLPPPPTPAGPFRAGDQAYWTASVPSTTYAKPLSGLVTALTILLSVLGLLSLAVAGTRVNRAAALQDLVEGPGSPWAVLSAENRLSLVGLIFRLGVLATGIVFIVWQYRHSTNARLLRGPSGLGPGWAIGGWFIPCANAVLPAVELHQSSRAAGPPVPGDREGLGNGLVIAWAVVLGLAGLIATIGTALYPTDRDVLADRDAAYRATLAGDRIGAVGFVVFAAAAVLAVVMVRSLSQQQASALRSAAEAPPVGGYGQPGGQAPGHGTPRRFAAPGRAVPTGAYGGPPPERPGEPGAASGGRGGWSSPGQDSGPPSSSAPPPGPPMSPQPDT